MAEKTKEEEIVMDIITKVTWWEYNQVTKEEFLETFGEKTGKDFWDRYCENGNLLDLWGKMDLDNRRKLSKRILHHYP